MARRMHVNKHKSARAFRAKVKRTKAPNVAHGVPRGGIRL